METTQKKSNKEFAIPHYQIEFEQFFRFAVSVDCVVFGYHNETLKVLLIKRGVAPFKGSLALPGDLVYPNENINVAASRVLIELTGISTPYIEQTKVYGDAGRHPAGRVITTGYYALVDIDKHDPQASAWADGVMWKDIKEVPQLAFDHSQILEDALTTLRSRVRRRAVGFELLPQKFTLAQIQRLYEVLLNEKYDKGNFRKKILDMNLLTDLKEMQTNVSHRPAKLFSFDAKRYQELRSNGPYFHL